MAEAGRAWTAGLLTAAGVLGACGVGLGAASAHLGGGDLARLAAVFLLLHAVAMPAFLAAPAVAARLSRVAATLIGCGAACFSGDVAVLAFTGRTPLSGLAPAGGIMLIAGWLVFAAAGAVALAGRGAASR